MRSQQISSRLSLLVSLLFIINLSVFMWSTIPVHASSQSYTVAKMQPDLNFQKDLDLLSGHPEKSDGYFASGSFGNCNWEISNGTLTISPEAGTNGELAACYSSGGPWNKSLIKITKVVIKPGVKANKGSFYLFAGLKDVTGITGLENLDGTSRVTSMRGMFSGCSKLTELDLSNFDTSQVTNMSEMFFNCSSLTKLDLSNFDTSRVTSMSEMFSGCSNLTNLDFSKFDTSNVKNMDSMFSSCSKLTKLDLSSFDTNQVNDMSYMFYHCSSLTKLDLSSFDTNQVNDMPYMFYHCSSLTKLDLSSFDTSQVTSMSEMFFNCSNLTNLDLSSFDTSQVTSMSRMFANCSSLTKLDLSSFDTSQVTFMWEMFTGMQKLWQIIMGEKFKIKDDYETYPLAPWEPTSFDDKKYTSSGGGYWQAVQGGTVHDPKGAPFRSDAFPTEREKGGKETYVWELSNAAPVINKIDKDSSDSSVKYPYVKDYRNTGSLSNFTISGTVSDSDSDSVSIYYTIDKEIDPNDPDQLNTIGRLSASVDSKEKINKIDKVGFNVEIQKDDLKILAKPKGGGHKIWIYAKDSGSQGATNNSKFSDPKQCLIAENGIIDFQYFGPKKEKIKDPQTLVGIVNTEKVRKDDQHYKVYKVSDYLPQDIWTSSTRYSLLADQIPPKLETLININKDTGQIPSTADDDQGVLKVWLNYNENGRVSLTEVPQLDFGDILLPTHKKPVPIKKQSGKLVITDTTGAPRWELTMAATPFYRVDPQSGKEIKDDKNKLDNLLIYHYANNTNKNITSDPSASVLISSYYDDAEVKNASTREGRQTTTNFQKIWWRGKQQIEGPMLLPPKNYSFKNKAHQVKYHSTVTWTLNNSL